MQVRNLRLVAAAAGAVVAILIAAPAQAKPVPVHRGDTLSGIVARECGSRDWSQAARDNARTNPNPNLIYAGQTLQINCTPARSGPAPVQASSGWFAPVHACIVSGFGMRWGRMHNGVDLAAGYGVAIHAAAAGTVSVGYQAGGAGNYVTVAHAGGVFTHSMHMSRVAVRSGQWVAANQVIGYVGATGNASGPHLHWEVRPYGAAWGGAVNPVGFMSARGVRLGC